MIDSTSSILSLMVNNIIGRSNFTHFNKIYKEFKGQQHYRDFAKTRLNDCISINIFLNIQVSETI